MKRSHLMREIIELIVISLVVFLVVRFVIHGYHMQSENMHPNIESETYVMVSRISPIFIKPERGDVIVLHSPQYPGQEAIARVIALPGDTIKIDHTHVWINDVQLSEPYIKAASTSGVHQWQVPVNSYFVLNDNRQVNDDSRSWGAIPKSEIVGKAVLVFWPFSKVQIIDTYTTTFDQLKNTP